MNFFKKTIITFILMLLTLILTSSLHAQVYVNYAEALQKSLYFYDANKCNLTTPSRLQWRAACHMRDYEMPLNEDSTNMSASFINANRSVLDPDGNGSLDLSGGYHDAGDHVKFGLPQGYSASTLGWGLLEFKQSFIDIGSYDHMLDILKYFTDYFLRCTFKNNSGDVVAFCYQVGDGAADHVCWCPPELWYELSTTDLRPAWFATSETPASDMCGEASASLAIMYFNYRDIDANYARECLDTAIALYEFGKANRGMGFSGGFYGSGYDEDELSWAAAWLNAATGDMSYIDDIMSQNASTGAFTGFLEKIVKTPEDEWQNSWVHCWDAVWGGVWTKLATLYPENDLFDYYSRWNIEYWSGGEIRHSTSSDSNYLNYTPGGYGMINTWGSARYNTAAQLCGLIYAKNKNRNDIADWARGQMTYIMGANPLNRSYIVGYSDNPVMHPHHRAAHGSLNNDMGLPPDHKHTLWGALAGGPDGSDNHKDIITDYSYNEVAIDYNAAFVGALAGLYEYFGRNAGHQPVADFPPSESHLEYYIEGKIENENEQGIELKLKLHIKPALPPRLESGFEARYYIDIDEILAAGKDISAIRTQVYYDEQGVLHGGPPLVIEAPVAVDAANSAYYIPLNWGAAEMVGTRELQFVIQISQDYTPGGTNPVWDGSNDYSYQGLGSQYELTSYIPVYHNGELVYGQPLGGTDPTPTPASTSAPTSTPVSTSVPTSTSTPPPQSNLGDVNDDGNINIIDALLVAQYYVNLDPVNFNPANADVDCDVSIDIIDALLIAQYYVDLIDGFC